MPGSLQMRCQTATERVPAAHQYCPVIAINNRAWIRDGFALSGMDNSHWFPIDTVAKDSVIAIQLGGHGAAAIVEASLQNQIRRIGVITIPRFTKRQDRALGRDKQGRDPVDVHAVEATDKEVLLPEELLAPLGARCLSGGRLRGRILRGGPTCRQASREHAGSGHRRKESTSMHAFISCFTEVCELRLHG